MYLDKASTAFYFIAKVFDNVFFFFFFKDCIYLF